MNNELRARLMGVSTGTLTYQLLKRNIRNVYMRGVLPLHPVTERMVGGIVTDGGIRDADAIRDIGLPVFGAGPAAPASPTAHCPAGLQEPISCGGVAVYPGDIIVADGDGCAVLPQALAEEVARDAAAQEGIEEFIQKLVASGRPVIGTYPASDTVRTEYETWLKAGKPAL